MLNLIKQLLKPSNVTTYYRNWKFRNDYPLIFAIPFSIIMGIGTLIGTVLSTAILYIFYIISYPFYLFDKFLNKSICGNNKDLEEEKSLKQQPVQEDIKTIRLERRRKEHANKQYKNLLQ